MAECAPIRDKNLQNALQKIDNDLEKIYAENPGIPKVKIDSGLRGTRYFIEFPIVTKNFDAFSLLASTKQKMEQGKNQYGVRVTNNDSYLADENVSYLLDYSVDSTTIGGTKAKGSVYIRGYKGQDGWDSFKFTIEKNLDFSQFDADLIVNAYEEVYKQYKRKNVEHQNSQPNYEGMSPAKAKFARR